MFSITLYYQAWKHRIINQHSSMWGLLLLIIGTLILSVLITEAFLVITVAGMVFLFDVGSVFGQLLGVFLI